MVYANESRWRSGRESITKVPIHLPTLPTLTTAYLPLVSANVMEVSREVDAQPQKVYKNTHAGTNTLLIRQPIFHAR